MANDRDYDPDIRVGSVFHDLPKRLNRSAGAQIGLLVLMQTLIEEISLLRSEEITVTAKRVQKTACIGVEQNYTIGGQDAADTLARDATVFIRDLLRPLADEMNDDVAP
ncbi:hypothetical protein GCM10017653_47240 [Ancylobacter defluvii]|uniref:Uncharacterized protein n=1 Tax=Ancylobacter defluvii TaxID=1282440 RepID=A0A9W6K279_9HYPH|nr:hypothetical protein GCM10017653_47240 [Ancylobacter defluvii]